MWERLLTEQDRERLGGDLEKAYLAHNTVWMWRFLRGVSEERAVVDLAYGLGFLTEGTRDWLLRELGQCFDDAQRTMDEAMLRSKLVVIEKPRQALWESEPIEIDWDRERALWSFFWELCMKSKQSQPIQREDLAEFMSPSAFSTRKGRLVNHPNFPNTLEGLVEAKLGGYQLNLQPQDIRIFQMEEEEKITEWTG